MEITYRILLDEPKYTRNEDGSRRRGNSYREAFWRGFDNMLLAGRIPYVRDSIAYAAYMAGREARKRAV